MNKQSASQELKIILADYGTQRYDNSSKLEPYSDSFQRTEQTNSVLYLVCTFCSVYLHVLSLKLFYILLYVLCSFSVITPLFSIDYHIELVFKKNVKAFKLVGYTYMSIDSRKIYS